MSPKLAAAATLVIAIAGTACIGEPVRRPPSSNADAGRETEDDAGAGSNDTGVPASARDAGDTGKDAATSQADASQPDAAGFADAAEMPREGVAVLGYNAHTRDAVTLTELSSGGMNVPRDLAFNPQGSMELWVVNRRDDSTVTFFGVGSTSMRGEFRIDPYALHFMEEVSSIAFGAPGRFATCQESRNTYNNTSPPNDFMGPSLWPSDMNIYAQTNEEAVREQGFDLGSHVDMLHESPLCMGIAWERDNIYWTFDGMTGSISRCDFRADHGPGYDDHSDGVIRRYGNDDVARVPGVPSHLIFDHATGLLYIADTGNARIAVLDTTRGSPGASLPVVEDGTTLTQMTGVSFTTLVDSAGGELQQPSGIALSGSLIFVSDHQTSRISAFDKTSGARVDYLDTSFPSGTLMGIELDAEQNIYFADAADDRLYRISPK